MKNCRLLNVRACFLFVFMVEKGEGFRYNERKLYRRLFP